MSEEDPRDAIAARGYTIMDESRKEGFHVAAAMETIRQQVSQELEMLRRMKNQSTMFADQQRRRCIQLREVHADFKAACNRITEEFLPMRLEAFEQKLTRYVDHIEKHMLMLDDAAAAANHKLGRMRPTKKRKA